MSARRTKATRVSLTKAGIRGIPPPARGRSYLHDSRVPGLCVEATPTGTKTFCVYRRVHGHPRRIRLGPWPDLSVERARKAAAKVLAEIAGGGDPLERRRAVRAEGTLGDLFDKWLEIHAKPSKKSWEADAANFRRYLEPWRNRKLHRIRRSDVWELRAKLATDHGQVTANRVMALLSSTFNWAISGGLAGWSNKPNPALRVPKFKESPRERFLGEDEIGKFLEAVAVEQNPTLRDFFLISLFVGARRSNTRAMRWDDLNLERGTWTIPAGEMKNGRPLTVPLDDTTLAILRQRHADAPEGSPWVFPGRKRGCHLMEPRKAWDRIRKRAGFTGKNKVVLHDLRRTIGSWEGNLGTDTATIARGLGHTPGSAATAIYDRGLRAARVRESRSNAVAAMLAASGVKMGGDDGEA